MNGFPQQAYRLFMYADSALFCSRWPADALACQSAWASMRYRQNKGQRKRVLRAALVCFLVFAMFYGTQASVLIRFVNVQWTPLLIGPVTLPVVVMLVGLAASSPM